MKRIAVLPCLLTLGNMFCGFTSIAEAADQRFRIAAWLILLAMVFDALDGKLARIARAATDFGAQLDSLADMVTFGVAPAFLMIRMSIEKGFPPYAAWVIGSAFATCAALRLARFNVETGLDEEEHNYFKGLPSPAAAGLVASLVALHYRLASDVGYELVWILRVLPLVGLAVSALMISNVRYVHVLNWLFKGQWPFDYFVQIVAVIFLMILFKPYSLMGGFAFYAASGLLITVHDRVAKPFAEKTDAP
ncbi:MAG: CDP-diacylglycerol--serine O-phosphatidyltransferase [Planctomycetes bacterium]|nr:CDP-diacylglycerol--serine O-phosphatidyltransferase [Planctomycetota bacterium]